MSTCYSKALALLSRRAYSTKQLSTKLAEYFFSPDDITAAIERLKSLHYLDDESLSQYKSQSLLRRGHGKYSRNQKLQQLGLESPAIDTEEEILAGAQYLLQKKSKLVEANDEKKLIQHMAQRGHGYQVIKKILTKLNELR
jgi:SOS response regulatory protein OraA/RecX